jgi:hypothetical protein
MFSKRANLAALELKSKTGLLHLCIGSQHPQLPPRDARALCLAAAATPGACLTPGPQGCVGIPCCLCGSDD